MIHQQTETRSQYCHPVYKAYEARVRMFGKWPRSLIQTPAQLAEAGFYYTGLQDRVRCYACDGSLENWNMRDEPWVEHACRFPDCVHVRTHREDTVNDNVQVALLDEQKDEDIADLIHQETETGTPPLSADITAMIHKETETSPQYRHPENKAYETRVRTFGMWPRSLMQTPTQLAEAGFYYTGLQDRVRCYACDGSLENWNMRDEPWVEHACRFPDCVHVRTHREDNSNSNVQVALLDEQEDEDIADLIHQETETGTPPLSADITAMLHKETETSPQYRHPENKAYETRLRTFVMWPRSLMQTQTQLAEAGFYYTGLQDRVRCYACDGSLENWNTRDEPWVEHACRFPDCVHVRTHREDTFNSNVQVALLDEQEDEDIAVVIHQETETGHQYRHTVYKAYETRMRTFGMWPRSLIQTPTQLAEAGFYYTGLQDRVRCYACDGSLENWNMRDEPWVEHACRFPDCVHVRTHREDTVNDNVQVALLDQQEYADTAVIIHQESETDPQYRNPEYEAYGTRMRTFGQWPKSLTQTPAQLAEAGFYYTGLHDQVRCYACNGSLQNWEKRLDPWIEHCRWYADCRHMRPYREEVFNTCVHVALRSQQEDAAHAVTTNQETDSGYRFISPMKKVKAQIRKLLKEHLDQGPQYRHPEYKAYETRMRTFGMWPGSLMQTPTQLAEAGFYYTGLQDQVRCYACDGSLQNWDTRHEPWIEHTRLFADCVHVRTHRDGTFNANVQVALLEPRENTQIYDEIPAFDTGQFIDLQQQEFPGIGWIGDIDLQQPDLPRLEELSVQEIDMILSDLPGVDHLLGGGHSVEAIRQWTREVDHSVYLRDVLLLCRHYCITRGAVSVVVDEDTEAGISTDQLLQENQRLLKYLNCKVCGQSEANVVFLPCGHLASCTCCVAHACHCPFCNTTIEKKVKAKRV